MLGESPKLTYNLPHALEEDPMEKFIIEGGIPLQGEVTPSGNKNAACHYWRPAF